MPALKPTTSFGYPLRAPNWPLLWVQYVRGSRNEGVTLDWDLNNCISWCCDWVAKSTGFNPYIPYAPKGPGVVAALSAIEDSPYETLDQILRSIFQEIPVVMAQQGDIVLVKAEAEWADSMPERVLRYIPHGCALAEPPFYWALLPGGLGKGNLYEDGVTAFAVGRNA